jgi:uncharacterized protein
MSAPTIERRPERARSRASIIDCDVHNAVRQPSDLHAYLPRRWHASFEQGTPYGGQGAGQEIGARPQEDIFRRDSVIDGQPGGSDLTVMQEQLLDRHNVSRAILHPVISVLRAPKEGEMAGAVARAINEWMQAEWLERDDRLYGAISVPVEDGVRAAREAERAAAHPRMVKVMLPSLTREGLGNGKYWPLYEVAAARRLPVAIHVAGFSGTHSATGWPTYFVEHHTALAQSFQAHVVSLVSSGVFKAFPQLRIVLEEGGLGWLPSLLWRMDHSWETMRARVPHLTEPPSAIVRRHFAMTTQPLDEPEQPHQLLQLLEQIDMNDRIMFASDYPHWDFDDPDRVLPASRIGAELRRRIFSENATAFFDFR